MITMEVNCQWLLWGDFNDVMDVAKKRGKTHASHKKYGVFRNKVDSCNLMNLDFIGHKFTWRRPIYHGGSRVYIRLYWGLWKEAWRMWFLDALVKFLTHLDFSHYHPILVSTHNNESRRGGTKFKFESALILEYSYDDMIRKEWNVNNNFTKNLDQFRR